MSLPTEKQRAGFIHALALLLPIGFAASPSLADTTVPGGNVFGLWTAAGSPYLVQGSITVPADSTLTIEPGVEVSFQGYYGLTVNGCLEAHGTEADSILFGGSSSWGGVTFANPAAVSHASYTSFAGNNNAGFTLRCDNSGPEISHCRITGTYGFFAGIYVVNSGHPSLTHCTISDNGMGILWASNANGVISDCVIARNDGDGMYGGGGVCVSYYCQLTFVDCTLSNNTHSQSRGGAAAQVLSSARLIFSGCTLSNNECTSSDARGGAVFCRDGAQAIFTDCTLSGNTCVYLAGVQGGGAISLYDGSATLTRCTLFENSTYDAGGAIAATNGSSFTLDQCTVDHNYSYGDGILYADSGSPVVVKNSILSNSYGIGAAAIQVYGALTLHHTAFFNNVDGDILGNIPAGFGELVQENANGDSCDVSFNIFMDPMYVDQPAGDHHLSAGSPCIDAGDPASPLDPDGTVTEIGAYWFDQRAPEIEISSALLDFGEVPLGEEADLPLVIYNVGTDTLLVYDVSCGSACFFTNFNPADSLILAGDSLEVTVTCAPQDTGAVVDTLDIENNDEPCAVQLTGYGQSLQGIEEDLLPMGSGRFALGPARPNPFNPGTTIDYHVPVPGGPVHLAVYDVSGRRVRVLLDGTTQAGRHQVYWDGRDANGDPVSSGIYFLKGGHGNGEEAIRMVVVR